MQQSEVEKRGGEVESHMPHKIDISPPPLAVSLSLYIPPPSRSCVRSQRQEPDLAQQQTECMPQESGLQPAALRLACANGDTQVFRTNAQHGLPAKSVVVPAEHTHEQLVLVDGNTRQLRVRHVVADAVGDEGRDRLHVRVIAVVRRKEKAEHLALQSCHPSFHGFSTFNLHIANEICAYTDAFSFQIMFRLYIARIECLADVDALDSL